MGVSDKGKRKQEARSAVGGPIDQPVRLVEDATERKNEVIKLRLSEITLTTKDGQYVRLTIDEARDLHAQLAELFAQSGLRTHFIGDALGIRTHN